MPSRFWSPSVEGADWSKLTPCLEKGPGLVAGQFSYKTKGTPHRVHHFLYFFENIESLAVVIAT